MRNLLRIHSIGLLVLSFSFLASCQNRKATKESIPELLDLPKVTSITSTELLNLAKTKNVDLMLINVWATWCQPCREEFPGLLKFRRDWQKKRVLLEFYSADFKSDLGDVHTFLKQQGVDFETFIRSESDSEFIDHLDKKWSGALPTTFIVDSQGKLVKRLNGQVTPAELSKIVSEILKNKKG